MISLETSISFAVLFSLMTVIGTGLNIYAVLHNTKKDSTGEKVEIQKNFARIEAKLDTFNSQLAMVNTNFEKTDNKTDLLVEEQARQKEQITSLFRLNENNIERIKRLEERL